MKLKIISGLELARLKPIFEKQGSSYDPKNLLLSAVTELPNGEIIGCIGLEIINHVGAVFVEESFRNQGIATDLYKFLELNLPHVKGTGYYTFPSTDISKKIALKLGLTKLDWEVWRREY